MIRDEHRTFIRTSLINIVRDVVYSTNALGNGMEAFAVHEYILQSLFLRMTGAQEQKMKCICWELATDDLGYRYERYYQGWALSECSTLDSKSKVYADLMKQIRDISGDSDYCLFKNEKDKKLFCKDICNKLKSVIENTNIAMFRKQKYDNFVGWIKDIKGTNINPDGGTQIFTIADKKDTTKNPGTELCTVYTRLYEHRNRCAHNATSYQPNLHTLQKLRDEKFQEYDNIFKFYAVLLIIDEIFIRLFEKYESLNRIM